MIKNSVEIESCRFVLEPSYKKMVLYILGKFSRKMLKKNANGYLANESAFCFSTLSDKQKIDLFNKQILTIEEIDASKLKLKPVSLNVDSLISDYILNDKYISDYLKKQKTLPLRLTKSFMNLILNAV